MIVKTEEQLQGLKACGKAVARAIREMGAALEPGMTSQELDDLGRAHSRRRGGRISPRIGL